MDMSYMNLMLGSTNNTISTNMQFLRNFYQNQNTGGQTTGGNTQQQPSQQSPQQGTISAEQAMYMQNLMFQMQQMVAMLQQIHGVFQKLQAVDTDFQGAGVSADQLSAIRSYLAHFQPAASTAPAPAPASSPAPAPESIPLAESGNRAIAYLGQRVSKEAHEQNAPDADNDGNVVGTGDAEQLKLAMDNGAFTATELLNAFQHMLARADGSKTDELLALFSLCEAQGMVSNRGLLRTQFISALPEDRMTLLADYLAEEGLVTSNGESNNRLATFVLNSLESNAPAKLNLFAKTVVQSLVAHWMTPDIPADNPDREYLGYLLRLAGFKFNPDDDTLLADAEQPFPVSPETAATA